MTIKFSVDTIRSILEKSNQGIKEKCFTQEQEEQAVNNVRIFIKTLSSEYDDFKSIFEYLEACVSVADIEDYYYNDQYDYYMIKEQKYDWNRLKNFVHDQNYLIEFTKIKPSFDNKNIEVIKDIENMNESYKKGKYKEVNTYSKSILETLFKSMFDKDGIFYTNKMNYNELFMIFYDNYNMNPKNLINDPDSQKLASKLISLSRTINEIRNIYSNSHGTTKNFIYTNHHAKLLVDTTISLFNFFTGVYKYQKDEDLF